ncbi:MAG TPA: signal recognition particle protein [Candidatus Micrarchaeia archaeon]|nr:signal recognition particle protein [Candidatus Micrarchaeia archaeon]
MFDALTDRLTEAFRRISTKGKLTAADVEAGLREVRLALLEADVHFRVARDFIERVRTRAVGEEVLGSLTPGQQVVTIVHEELVGLLGGETQRLTYEPRPPTVVMTVGLQGSGKTTTAIKLALLVRREGHRPLVVAADLHRPAAIDQLEQLGRASDVAVVRPAGVPTDLPAATVAVCRAGLEEAQRRGADVVILDTAGRLQLDPVMQDELDRVRQAVPVHHALLVVDAMSGQEAVNVATVFKERSQVTGAVLTKLDGDARGGAALSMRAATGLPILYCGIGERPQDLEPFHPDRMARRILGMGDVLTLAERALEQGDRDVQAQVEERMLAGRLTLDDFVAQLRQLRRMGSMASVLGMLPGGRQLIKSGGAELPDDRQLGRMEAIVLSMTPAERRRPEIVDASRRRRIASGSGTAPADVSRLLKGFGQLQGLMRGLGAGGGRRGMAERLLRGSIPGLPPGALRG